MQNHANITIRIPYHHTHNLADRQDKKYTSQPTKRGGIMLKRLHKAESKQKKTNRIWRGKKHLAMHANPLSARMHNPILEEQRENRKRTFETGIKQQKAPSTTADAPTRAQGYSPARFAAGGTWPPNYHRPSYSAPSSAAPRTWSWGRCARGPGWPCARG